MACDERNEADVAQEVLTVVQELQPLLERGGAPRRVDALIEELRGVVARLPDGARYQRLIARDVHRAVRELYEWVSNELCFACGRG
jgi:hypothetical protein